MFIARMRVPA